MPRFLMPRLSLYYYYVYLGYKHSLNTKPEGHIIFFLLSISVSFGEKG